eukprot:GEMP01031814.1.p1 GENE.GEMP01031814.1~~GEMP01031814.1.p1  ORF type:complete len:420 (+),score=82.46 GEMP01031814.1:130-1389(+)
MEQFAFDLTTYFNNPKYSDVIIRCSDQKQLQYFAHKVILSLSSSVFQAMFAHKFKENLTSEVVVEADGAMIGQLLQHIYHLPVEVSEADIFPLLDLGKKYGVESLTSECENFLQKTIRASQPKEMCQILPAAMRYGCHDVVNACCEGLLGMAIPPMDLLLDLDLGSFQAVAQSDDWQFEEDRIFDLAVQYCKVHAVSFDLLLPYLRIPQLSAEKLAWARDNDMIPDKLLCDATLFKLGVYNKEWLRQTGFRRRQSQVGFVQTPGFKIIDIPRRSLTELPSIRLVRTGNGGRNIRAEKRMRHPGRYEMNFEILTNPRDVIFGIMDAKDDHTVVAHESSGRMVGCHMQKRRHQGMFCPRQGGDKSVAEGDIVRCVLDLHDGSLAYSVNNVQLEVAFGDLPLDNEYVFCMDLYNEGTTLEIF